MSFTRRCLVHHLDLDELVCPLGHIAEQHHAGTDRMEPAFEVYDTARHTILWEVHGDSIGDRFERDYTTTCKVDGRDGDGFSRAVRLRHEDMSIHEQRAGRRRYNEKILEQVCAGCGRLFQWLTRHQRRADLCRGLGPSTLA